MPSHNLLLQLHGYDKSSSEYHDQLCNIIYGEEYQRLVPNLQDDDLVWLIDYLDKVHQEKSR